MLNTGNVFNDVCQAYFGKLEEAGMFDEGWETAGLAVSTNGMARWRSRCSGTGRGLDGQGKMDPEL